jgi:ABC-2 type transport system ATP-binding protein
MATLRESTCQQSRDAGPAVLLSHVVFERGPLRLIDDASFTVPRGVICGLLAPSGGGKTTLIRLITGAYVPTAGRLQVLGSAPSAFSFAERRRIGYMPQQFVLYPELSVERNLDFVGSVYGLSGDQRRRRSDAVLALVDLQTVRGRRASRLSGGMQRRLQLAATLLHQPDLILSDEPTAGIDPLLRARIWADFRRLRDEGRTLIVATQYVTEADYCDQLVLVNAGRVIATGSPASLRRRVYGAATVNELGAPLTFEDVFRRIIAAGGVSEE